MHTSLPKKTKAMVMTYHYSIAKQAAFLRRPVGLIFLGLAILGFVMPILPSWPFIIPAVALLGRRDRSLRRTHLLLRHGLRVMRRSRQPWLRQVGLRFSTEYVRAKRTLTPAISAAERAFGSG